MPAEMVIWLVRINNSEKLNSSFYPCVWDEDAMNFDAWEDVEIALIQ
jgi:hypothetical protein